MEKIYAPDNVKVAFSSGALETLYGAWVTLGTEMAGTPDEEAVVAWLDDRRMYGGDSARAFSLNPPTEELASRERLLFLKRLVAATREKLDQPEPDPDVFEAVVWTDELRAEWICRLVKLEELLGQAAGGI